MNTTMGTQVDGGEAVDAVGPAGGAADLRGVLAGLMRYFPQGDKVDVVSAKLGEKPAQNTLMILGLSAVLFYVAEKDRNAKVNSIFDALEYCSSSLSVGYTSIYPSTPIGKVVATLLMTYGPALSGAMLDGPRKKGAAEEEMQGKILKALEEILGELRKGDRGPRA